MDRIDNDDVDDDDDDDNDDDDDGDDDDNDDDYDDDDDHDDDDNDATLKLRKFCQKRKILKLCCQFLKLVWFLASGPASRVGLW